MKMDNRIKNIKKTVVVNQKYEKYWSITLGMTDFFKQDGQSMRILQMIVDHIDKYELYNYSDSELIRDFNSKRKRLNQEVTHAKELEQLVFSVFPNNDRSGATTRKQLNQFIKLGFIQPYYRGYPEQTKKFLSAETSLEEKKRLFSEIVYRYATLNSSQTNDETADNQIKYLVNTLINRESKMLNLRELIGLMLSDLTEKGYADEKDIMTNSNWAEYISFSNRKYNQIGYLKKVINSMNLFEMYETNEYIQLGALKKKNIIVCLRQNAKELIPERGDTKRDSYRFMLMKKAVIDETIKCYGKKVSWFSKEESKGLVVSHIYASADALKNWDIDEAYDPNNALYLKPGDEDQYFDKYDLTFDSNGKPYFSSAVRKSYIDEVVKKGYHLDKKILNPNRVNYLTTYHNKKFKGII